MSVSQPAITRLGAIARLPASEGRIVTGEGRGELSIGRVGRNVRDDSNASVRIRDGEGLLGEEIARIPKKGDAVQENSHTVIENTDHLDNRR